MTAALMTATETATTTTELPAQLLHNLAYAKQCAAEAAAWTTEQWDAWEKGEFPEGAWDA